MSRVRAPSATPKIPRNLHDQVAGYIAFHAGYVKEYVIGSRNPALVIVTDLDHLPGKVDHRADDESDDRHGHDQPTNGPVPRLSASNVTPERP